jgi:hypothetical protein
MNMHRKQLALLVLIGTLLVVLAGTEAQPAQASLLARKTRTPRPTVTNTPLATATNSSLPTATNTRQPKATNTPQPTATPTSTGMATATPTPGPNPNGVWEFVESPNTGSPHNYFNGMAAIAPNDVWAVGAYGNTTTVAEQLIQHWNGQSWTLVATPALATTLNELMAVSAVSANDVWAVGSGDGFGLIEHWDGTSWSVVPHPNPGIGNRFFGVAAIASDDVWAVGYQGGADGLSQTLVERWDGDSWSVVPSPNVPNQHNTLFAVTAVPGSNELWAVGRADPSTPLILHWNGTQWSIVPGPSSGTVPLLYGVTAISTNDVWAAGWTSFGGSGPDTLTLHWNGSTWSVVPSPNPSATYNYLWAIDASAAGNVWAVGDFNAPGGHQQNLLLRWNGTTWVQVPGDNTAPDGDQFFLRAVSAFSASDVWIGGQFSGHALAEHWNGSVWSQVSAPNAGIGDNILNGVSGTSSTDVWQVGFYWFGTENRTLIHHWDGTDWSIVPSPNEYVRLNTLNGVFAISPSDAWAVGSDSSGTSDQTTLTMHWNGTSWTIVPSPSPGTLGLNALYGVSANAANDVWAVGSFTNVGEYSKSLILHWNGSSWSQVPSPNAPGVNNALYGVVALGPNDVWAVGYKGVVDFETLILHWNGANWSIVPSPTAVGFSSILSAVSGSGANDIWTVGRTRNPFNFQTGTLIEYWNGNVWEAVFGFGGSGPDHALYGVAAVSPGDAWAVGDSGAFALIGRWDGSSWMTFPSPTIAGRLYAATAISACDVWAVGQRYVEGVGILTLSEHFTCN